MCADCALNRICVLLLLSQISENLEFESIDHSNASFVNTSNFINASFVVADASVIPRVT
jgi:hypothetical protein